MRRARASVSTRPLCSVCAPCPSILIFLVLFLPPAPMRPPPHYNVSATSVARELCIPQPQHLRYIGRSREQLAGLLRLDHGCCITQETERFTSAWRSTAESFSHDQGYRTINGMLADFTCFTDVKKHSISTAPNRELASCTQNSPFFTCRTLSHACGHEMHMPFSVLASPLRRIPIGGATR